MEDLEEDEAWMKNIDGYSRRAALKWNFRGQLERVMSQPRMVRLVCRSKLHRGMFELVRPFAHRFLYQGAQLDEYQPPIPTFDQTVDQILLLNQYPEVVVSESFLPPLMDLLLERENPTVSLLLELLTDSTDRDSAFYQATAETFAAYARMDIALLLLPLLRLKYSSGISYGLAYVLVQAALLQDIQVDHLNFCLEYVLVSTPEETSRSRALFRHLVAGGNLEEI